MLSRSGVCPVVSSLLTRPFKFRRFTLLFLAGSARWVLLRKPACRCPRCDLEMSCKHLIFCRELRSRFDFDQFAMMVADENWDEVLNFVFAVLTTWEEIPNFMTERVTA